VLLYSLRLFHAERVDGVRLAVPEARGEADRDPAA